MAAGRKAAQKLPVVQPAGLVFAALVRYNKMKSFNGAVFVLNGLLSPAEILRYVLRAAVVLVALPFHESAHALVSHWLGDDTALRQGRISMNPLRHLDPIGAVCMLVGGVGWAKPVSVNARNFRNPKVGMALTAAAGPISNLLLAWVAAVLYRVCYRAGNVPILLMLFYYAMVMNLSLAAFNLIPLPPFDGSRIALLFLPQRLYFKVMQYERYIMLAVLLLTFTGLLDRPLSAIVNVLLGGLMRTTDFVDLIGGSFARGINI